MPIINRTTRNDNPAIANIFIKFLAVVLLIFAVVLLIFAVVLLIFAVVLLTTGEASVLIVIPPLYLFVYYDRMKRHL